MIFPSFLPLLLVFGDIDAARILGAVFTPSYSHQVVFQPIWRELSLRGHEITVLTTNPMRDKSLKNLTEIDLSFSYDIMKRHKADDLLSTSTESVTIRYKKYMQALHEVADAQLAHREVQDLLKHKRHDFDLLMVEVIYPTQMVFSWWFEIPFIGLVSLDAPLRLHEVMGNPTHPLLYPPYDLPFDRDNMSFLERVISLVFYFFFIWYSEVKLHPREESTWRKFFGEEVPNVNEIQKNMSLLFLNTNPVFHNVRPLLPSTVTIGGGLHLNQDIEPLRKDVLGFLNGSKQGFVYFSLGTNVKSAAIANSTKATIIQALTEVPYNVLWKFEENIDLPKNVKIVQWVNQKAVLAHPNIKLFITQCGLQSMEEAILSHVPMIGIPFYGDQGQNSNILKTRGLGVTLQHQNLEKSDFVSAILEVSTNPVFKENLQEIAMLLKDEMVSGLEKAVWWTEYLLRHKSVQHLKSRASDLPTYQYFFLDVIIFLVGILFTLLFILIKFLKFIVGRIFTKSKKKSE